MNCKKYILHIWHAFSTNEALSYNTKVNDLVTLTFILKIVNFGLRCRRGHSCLSNLPVLFIGKKVTAKYLLNHKVPKTYMTVMNFVLSSFSSTSEYTAQASSFYAIWSLAAASVQSVLQGVQWRDQAGAGDSGRPIRSTECPNAGDLGQSEPRPSQPRRTETDQHTPPCTDHTPSHTTTALCRFV